MKHRSKPSLFKNRLGIFIVIVAIIVILLIIFGSKGAQDTSQINDSLENDSLNQEQEDITSVQKELDVDKTNLEKVIEKTLSEKGLCEDYNFNEGDTLELNNHKITVERIATTSAKITVDGTTFFLAPENDKVVNNLRVELHDGQLFYFGAQDSENIVVLRIGCKYSDEDPNEKYVRERGETLCKDLYKECKDSFGIK